MYKAKILIVKTSSLGDIIQAFPVLDELHRRFPTAQIDWAVEALFAPIVAAHPLVHRAIPLDMKRRKNLYAALKELRKESYDLVFDLQGNCKSGLITALSRGKTKVGYDFHSVREWPNILATHVRFFVSKEQNVRLYYLQLLEKFFKTPLSTEIEGVRFKIEESEQQKVAAILAQVPPGMKILVCPGSKWANKQLKKETWIAFLQKIEDASFFFSWGDEAERKLSETIAQELKHAYLVEKLPLPTWQNLMNEMDLVIAVDSSALHLCGTTKTPSFSIFGPTSSSVFKPIGEKHLAFQGPCPYGRTFDKQCPILRNCPTGACIKEIDPENLFKYFQLHKITLNITGRL